MSDQRYGEPGFVYASEPNSFGRRRTLPVPHSLQSRSANFDCRLVKVMNSEVHTGVKSAGWLKRITQLPAY